MALKVFFLLSFIGLASATLPNIRTCDDEEMKQTPTLCSNYENIEAVYAKKEQLMKSLAMLNKTMVELNKTINNDRMLLKQLETNLTKVTQSQQRDIKHLKEEVSKLVRHKDHVAGNFSEIEKKLEVTESQLEKKKAHLETLETQTEAAFNDTRRLLSLYERELSKLNATAQDLEDTVDVRLNATKTDLEDELSKMQKKNAAFSARLDSFEAEIRNVKRHANSRLDNVSKQLLTQNHTVNLLRNETTDLGERLLSADKRMETEANAKVAFSASIFESSHVFTGPRTVGGKSVLVFNRVFTNIGNAYSNETGIFTAPVKGVYQFTFMTFGYHSHTSGAILLKNGRYQVCTWESAGSDDSDTTSNTVILELNVGDCVNIILRLGGKIYYSVFSGFLIFPLI